MKIIHEDHNGVVVVSHEQQEGQATAGHRYEFRHGEVEIGGLNFQFGPVKQVGVNGVQTEGVLSALIDRTQVLDAAFQCDENKEAIAHLEEALHLFNKRTADRRARQVEGLAKA